MNITTAKQDALDLWGNLLGFYRYIPRDDNPEMQLDILTLMIKCLEGYSF